MTECRNCGSGSIEAVLSLGEQPLANAYLRPGDEDKPEGRYPLGLVHCADCSLVQLSDTVPPGSLFSDYPYFSSVSDAFVEHAGALAGRVAEERGLDASSLVVEVGSNDGYLLRHYAERGIGVLGVDPAANIAEAARSHGIPTMTAFFGQHVADDLAASGRLADVVHANNVLAHVPDIHDAFGGIATILKPTGVVIIETPYVRDLVERVEFDTVYHEHVFYYSLRSLSDVLDRHGLSLVDVERIPVHGGSIRVTAAHASASPKQSERVSDLLAEEAAVGVDGVGYYRDFSSRVDALRGSLRSLLASLKADDMSIAAYGAAAKGTVLLNAFDIGTETIDFVADRSPHKQGLLMPGKHIPIVPAEDLSARAPDVCVLLAWNFADEIVAQQAGYRSSGGRFIVPVPDVRYVD